jgi:ATP-dependent Lhr-like helicase
VPQARAFRSRRTTPASGEGRWSLVEARVGDRHVSDTEWASGIAQQLLTRYGIVTREVAGAEGLAGGFSGVYDVFRTLEERGRLRRGFFASGVGATQFAVPAALDLLRSLRADPDAPEVVTLAATDPANPYGAILKWPDTDTPLDAGSRGPTRSVGASVVLVNGALSAYMGRQGRSMLSYVPSAEPDRSGIGRAVAAALSDLAVASERVGAGLLIGEINGRPSANHPLTGFLLAAGFVASALGLRVPRRAPATPAAGERSRAARSPSRTLRSSPFAALRVKDDE